MQFPERGRLAGIDYGEKRIGVAICDPSRMLASPYENYTRGTAQADARYFRNFVEQEDVVGFVVGLPVHASGDESQKSRETRAFAAWLSSVTSRPVCFVDERYSTRHADAMLRDSRLTAAQRKRRRDMLAAQFILSTYLDSPQTADARPAPIDDQDSSPN